MSLRGAFSATTLAHARSAGEQSPRVSGELLWLYALRLRSSAQRELITTSHKVNCQNQ